MACEGHRGLSLLVARGRAVVIRILDTLDERLQGGVWVMGRGRITPQASQGKGASNQPRVVTWKGMQLRAVSSRREASFFTSHSILLVSFVSTKRMNYLYKQNSLEEWCVASDSAFLVSKTV